eukprot:2847939-Prymnesium_polylepis.1
MSVPPRWASKRTPTADPPPKQARWASPSELQVEIIEATPAAARPKPCMATTVTLRPELAVRDALRTSLPSEASFELLDSDCEP